MVYTIFDVSNIRMENPQIKYKGKYLELHTWSQKLLNGGFTEFEKVTRRPTVSIIAVTNNEVILINEHRYESNKIVSKFPAGFLDDHEKPEDGAQRELQEEVGFKAGKLTLIGKTEDRSTFSFPEYVFLAEDLTTSKLPYDEGESIIDVYTLPKNEVAKRILNNELYYSFTSFVFLKHFWSELKDSAA